MMTVDESGRPRDWVFAGLTGSERQTLLGWPDGTHLLEHFRNLPRPLRIPRPGGLRRRPRHFGQPVESEDLQCESAAGVLCLLPWLRRFGMDSAIEQAGCPGTSQLPPLPSVLASVGSIWNQRNLPALLKTHQARKPVRIPWIGNRRIVCEGDTRS